MTLHACPPESPEVLSLDASLCVGFGYVEVTKDGEQIWQGDDWEVKLRKFEGMARNHPGEWRVTFEGPLSGAVYRREAEARWVRISTNKGFA